MDGVKVRVAYAIARRLVARRQAVQGVAVQTTSWDAYAEWREDSLRKQLLDCFRDHSPRGKVVLDFGCGDGALCVTLAALGAASVHGVDIRQDNLSKFAERLALYEGNPRPTFSLSRSPKKIDEPSEKFDGIYCFDTMEHVMDYAEIISEWHRILKPGGSVYIWWQPYWHPYGHHATPWLPIPWAHVVLDNTEIHEVCARIVDWEGFMPPIYDQNPDGSKKNRFRAQGVTDDYLNKLTVREFETICSKVGFCFAKREFRPFGLPQPAQAISKVMTAIPIARDYFTACAIYELHKDGPGSRSLM